MERKTSNIVPGWVDIVLGLQWGDEGKGKIVDYLAPNYGIVARFQGGPNAGHTLWHKGKKLVLHNLPSGILHDKVWNFIGPGCVVDPTVLLSEIKDACEILETNLSIKDRIFVSKHAFVVHPLHKWLDKAIEHAKGRHGVGTTGKGIGPTYSDIKDRIAFRFGDLLGNTNFFISSQYMDLEETLWKELKFYSKEYGYVLPEKEESDKAIDYFKYNILDLSMYVNFVDLFWLQDQLDQGKDVLAEGAQGTMLDNNFGCYPMVTSSNTIAGAASVGLGVPMKYFGKTIGVAKWYTTKVGEGIFPSEIKDEHIQNLLQEAGQEVGATTGRKRKCGWLDIPQLLYALRINDVDELIITKVDINPLDEVKVLSSYLEDQHIDDFPFDISTVKEFTAFRSHKSWKMSSDDSELVAELKLYLKYIEMRIEGHGLQTEITMVSHGPKRDDIIRC